MKKVLVTGGSGFFGGALKRRLLTEGYDVVNLDLVAEPDPPATNLKSIQGDIRDTALVDTLFATEHFDAVMHCAAMLAHEKIADDDLWTSNVDGTHILAEAARKHSVKPFVFISTNCLWAHNVGRPVREDDIPAPVELYGRSKLAAEEALKPFENDLNIVTIRCPTIIEAGRLGLLAILFEFIDEGHKVWVVGDGGNRYQFIDAQDLATACIASANYTRSDLFHIGAANVPTLREVYQAIIDAAGTKARVAQLPEAPTIAAMKLAHKLGVSPLGPYHYRMIAEDFEFDTTRIRQRLGWSPTVSNQEMMVKAYRYYSTKRKEIESRAGEVSAHSRGAAMGVIRLLKWVS
ncbi:NAD-dependent epimerase/dehydratase family protein [Granulicella sibirica]|uniref:UDP-glucose 4-epimerase n=1 Tax=Granulicella sibirica TaxID=2479048 RepID=A0A4Q0T7S5_9BACT|nr:NAD(P)-dependent oxidoreductase [Granulicella sibirica]RXH58770.1 UDP-glucose 4-epimerase [Granulicella sibirica]